MSSEQLEPPTRQQLRCLLWLIDNIVQYSPTRREMQAGLGYKSVNAVTVHLDELAKKGWIEMEPKKSRNIKVLQCPKT